MSDENWIRELANVNREQQREERDRFDERWDRLSAGELSPEEEAELRALAETSGEAREVYEAFRPLGPEFHASVVQAIRKQGLAPAETKAPEPPAKLLPFRRRAPLWAGWSAAAMAAAALFLFLRSPVPLPVYTSLEVHGDQALRGEEAAPAEVPVLAPGARFQGTIQIATASRARNLEDEYFLVRGQEVRRLEVESLIDPGGAIKMKGSVGRDLSPGAWTLWAVIGRQGKLPEPAELQRFSTRSQVRREDWVAVAKEIRIQNRDLPP